jgi:FkbM family methyltransferase
MLKTILAKLSGNSVVQKILEKNISVSLLLSGVGSGTNAGKSGEKVVLDLLYNLQEPYCIFDVGANKGQYLSVLFNELSHRNFEIHCFEPGKYSFEILKNNAPDSAKVKLNNIGLGQSDGEFPLYYNEKGSGLASLTKRRLDHFNLNFSESEKIRLTTLDNYCMQNGIEHIHLLKLDVEGHELDVLKGADKMFSNKSIDIVTFEFGGCNIDTRSFFQDFYYFFKEQNMEIFRITPSGYLFPIKKYREEYEQFITTNFVAKKIK